MGLQEFLTKKRTQPLQSMVDGPMRYDLYYAKPNETFNTEKVWMATCIEKTKPIVDLVVLDTINQIPVQLSKYCFQGCKNLVSIAHLPESTPQCIPSSAIVESGLRELPEGFTTTDYGFAHLRNLHNYEELIKRPEIESQIYDAFSMFGMCKKAIGILESEKAKFETLPQFVAYKKVDFTYWDEISVIMAKKATGEWHAIVGGELNAQITEHPTHNNMNEHLNYSVRAINYWEFMKTRFPSLDPSSVKTTNLSIEEGINAVKGIYDRTIELAQTRMEKSQEKEKEFTDAFRSECSALQTGVEFTPREAEQPSLEEQDKKTNEAR